MEIDEKAIIIEQFAKSFTAGYIDREFFSDFVIYNDLGIPLAQFVVYELGVLNDSGANVLEETWRQLCDFLDLDPDEEYDDFEEMLDLFEEDLDDD